LIKKLATEEEKNEEKVSRMDDRFNCMGDAYDGRAAGNR
jgi:hypothetical protein